MQVEVPGGRGKPPIIVDKDEGLGKVKMKKKYLNYTLKYVSIYIGFSWYHP